MEEELLFVNCTGGGTTAVVQYDRTVVQYVVVIFFLP